MGPKNNILIISIRESILVWHFLKIYIFWLYFRGQKQILGMILIKSLSTNILYLKTRNLFQNLLPEKGPILALNQRGLIKKQSQYFFIWGRGTMISAFICKRKTVKYPKNVNFKEQPAAVYQNSSRQQILKTDRLKYLLLFF